MIEVVFSQSACGSLKVAQRYGTGKCPDGAIGFIFAKREEGPKPSKKELEAAKKDAEARARQEWERAIPLGGNPADVYGIDVAWSIGDIAENGIGSSRRKVLEQLSSTWAAGDDAGQRMDQMILKSRNSLREVLERASRGEAVRIWYSHNPDEICGFYWLLTQLQSVSPHGPIYSIKLPEWEYSDQNTLCAYIGWGEISPGKWGRYLPLQQEVKPALLSACAMRWRQLQEENDPLRIFLNGKLQGAPENIYDSFILRELEAQSNEFLEANVIGNLLGRYQLGIGDAWIALRIEKFIKEGLFEPISAPDPDRPIYGRMLRKSGRKPLRSPPRHIDSRAGRDSTPG